MNNKIIFTTLIAMSALLCTQKSLTVGDFLKKKGGTTNGGVPIQEFDAGEYRYDFSLPFDVLKNETDTKIKVTLHTPGHLTQKLTVFVEPYQMKAVQDDIMGLNRPQDRISLNITQCGGKDCSQLQSTNFSDEPTGQPRRFNFLKMNYKAGTGRVFTITKNPKQPIYTVITSTVTKPIEAKTTKAKTTKHKAIKLPTIHTPHHHFKL